MADWEDSHFSVSHTDPTEKLLHRLRLLMGNSFVQTTKGKYQSNKWNLPQWNVKWLNLPMQKQNFGGQFIHIENVSGCIQEMGRLHHGFNRQARGCVNENQGGILRGYHAQSGSSWPPDPAHRHVERYWDDGYRGRLRGGYEHPHPL